MNLRDRKKQEARILIREKAIELFISKGFSNVSVDEIVSLLNVSRRTFFRYFPAKEDVVFDWYDELRYELVDTLKKRSEKEDAYEAVCATLSTLLKYYDQNQDWSMKMMRLSRENPALIAKSLEKRMLWENELSMVISERIGKGQDKSLRAKIIVGKAMTAFYYGVDQWFTEGGKRNLYSILQKSFEFAK